MSDMTTRGARMDDTPSQPAGTLTLAQAMEVVEDLANEITSLIDVAASDADVEVEFSTARVGSAQKMVALELVNRLIASGWSFSYNEVDEATR
jgi:hypothetical protein